MKAKASHSFSRILFRREGGGNKTFFVTADESRQALSFEIVKYNFKDTAHEFERTGPQDREVRSLVSSILSGRTSVEGAAAPPTKPTGSWVHLYAVTPDDAQVEITDPKICQRLMTLESYVEAEQSDLGTPR